MTAIASSRRRNWYPALVIAGVLGVVALHHMVLRPRADQHRPQGVTIRDVDMFFPKASALVQEGNQQRFTVVDAEGKDLGSVIDTSRMVPPIMGYAGPVPCVIALGLDQHVLGIMLLDSAESPSFLEYIAEVGFLDNWNGLPAAEALTLEVDAISGATLTTVAVIESIRRGLGADLKTPAAGPKVGGKIRWQQALFWIALLFGLLSFILPKMLRRSRPILLIVNVLVIGLLSGEVLSLAQLQGWLTHGIPLSRLPILAGLGCAALLLPLLTGRDYYCTYVCPFGSAQDLVGMLWRWQRPSVPRRTLRLLHTLRLAMLMGAMVIALGWLSRDLAAWEPFAAFQWRSAPRGALLIAVVSLLFAVWVPRFWCRAVCPTGCILDTWRPRKLGTKSGDHAPQASVPGWSLPVLVLLAACLAVSHQQQPEPAGSQSTLGPVPPPVPYSPMVTDDLFGGDDPFAPTDQVEGGDDPFAPLAQRGVLAVIHSRKSVRNYTDDPVTTEQLQTLLRAGMAGPTAGNAQPWAFVAVTERERMRQLADGLPYGKMLDHAGAAIVVCGVPGKALPGESNSFWVQDCSAAAQTILLAAEGTGLGAVWVGVYPLLERIEAVRAACGIPDTAVPLCVISIGHPMGVEQALDKYTPDNIHWNTW